MKYLRPLAFVIGLACLGLLARLLIVEWSEVSDAIGDASWGWLALALALAAGAMTSMAWGWQPVLGAVGAGKFTTARVIPRYFVGELGKYLPGGVWPVLGRSELIVAVGAPRVPAYTSTLVSLMMLYLTALVLSGPAALWSLAAASDTPRLLVVCGFAPLALFVIHPRVAAVVCTVIERASRRRLIVELPVGRQALSILARYGLAWALVVAATATAARALAADVSVSRIAVATLLAWVAGFAVVPLPGGLGVREAVFVGLCGLPEGVAVGVALVVRLLFVVADGLGALVSAPSVAADRRSSSTETAG